MAAYMGTQLLMTAGCFIVAADHRTVHVLHLILSCCCVHQAAACGICCAKQGWLAGSPCVGSQRLLMARQVITGSCQLAGLCLRGTMTWRWGPSRSSPTALCHPVLPNPPLLHLLTAPTLLLRLTGPSLTPGGLEPRFKWHSCYCIACRPGLLMN